MVYGASPRIWYPAVCAWVGVILFSSTALAQQYCYLAFDALHRWLLGGGAGAGPGGEYLLLRALASKALHLALFFLLAVLLSRVVSGSRTQRFVHIVAIGLLTGCASETLQAFFPGRDPALRDVLINVFGTALGERTANGIIMKPGGFKFGKHDVVARAGEEPMAGRRSAV